MSERELVALVCLAMGGLGLVMGTLVRLGARNRRFFWQYDNPRLPGSQRNSVFAWIPLGLAFIIGGVIITQPGPTSAASVLFVFASALALVVLLGVSFWIMWRPPRWSKPAWLLAQEDGRRAGEPVPETPQPEMTPGVYRLSWLVLGLAVVGWWIIGHPSGVLVGLGVGATFVIAMRPRQQRS
jgi:hypothetical protein